MKQLLFAAGLLLLISCNDGTTGAGTNENNAQRNAERSSGIYKAIETGDVSKLDSFIAEDIIDHNGGLDGRDIVGRDSVKKMIGEIHTYFEDGLKIEKISEATSADGVYHYALIRMRGKAKQNPWGMPVGQDIDDTSVDVVKIKDGMAAEHWGFLSWGDINEMMSAMKGGNNKPGGNNPTGADTTQR